MTPRVQGWFSISLLPWLQLMLRVSLGATLVLFGGFFLMVIDLVFALVKPHGASFMLLFVARPLLIFLATILLAMLLERFGNKTDRRALVFLLVIYGGVAGVLQLAVSTVIPWMSFVATIPITAVLYAALLLLSVPLLLVTMVWKRQQHRFRGRRMAYISGAVLILGVVAVLSFDSALIYAPARLTTNRLGLVAFPPNSSLVLDYATFSNKDNYPTCVYNFNSLGYRDREPPVQGSKQMPILLVGDSFIWGDGIPSHDLTLGAQLQSELDHRTPSRYQVISAAYPGNGIYGYSRAVEELAPIYQPVAVIIGYLGDADHDPLDPQHLADFVTSRGWLGRYFVTLGLMLYVRATTSRHREQFWKTNEARRGSQDSWERMQAARNDRQRCSLVLHYTHTPEKVTTLPAGWHLEHLSSSHRYTGRSNTYWYGRDFHPRPLLNRILAKQLAVRLQTCLGSTTDSRASAARPPSPGAAL